VAARQRSGAEVDGCGVDVELSEKGTSARPEGAFDTFLRLWRPLHLNGCFQDARLSGTGRVPPIADRHQPASKGRWTLARRSLTIAGAVDWRLGAIRRSEPTRED
jgi:hypothetical protein